MLIKHSIHKIIIIGLCVMLIFPFYGNCASYYPQKEDSLKKFKYGLLPREYKTKLRAGDPKTWNPAHLGVNVPVNGVSQSDSGLFKPALKRNIDYLLNSFSVNHMLSPFRKRAGIKNPPDDRTQIPFWDTDLRGSSAGRFLMGACNTLRWIKNTELSDRVDKIIDAIDFYKGKGNVPKGYILPYRPDDFKSEEPNYARAWLTHGLIEAGIYGNLKAYELLRGHADWFNHWDGMLPELIYWHNNSHQGHIASTRTYFSPVGKPEDLEIAEKYYVCDWWMDELIKQNKKAIWRYPLQNPHCYLITSFEAYLDHYIATGDEKFLNAMYNAWNLIHDNWEHVGGSIALCESQWVLENGKLCLWKRNAASGHPPKSYYLTTYGHTGETCCSVFWAKFNQRFHRLFPDQEKYVNEIEKTIYNVILANQTGSGNIRYHTNMEGEKDSRYQIMNTCCEGQGTRMMGSLPEYIYSLTSDGIYINLYEPSSIDCTIKGNPITLNLESNFPFNPDALIRINTNSRIKMKIRIRVPSWAERNMPIFVNGELEKNGEPGSYVVLERFWNNNDSITFSLPMELNVTHYIGYDSIPGHERYAVKYGPILLAAVGALKGNNSIYIKHNPAKPQDWLKMKIGNPLFFSVEGDSQHFFMPYWLISDETFTTYPVIEDSQLYYHY